MIYQTHNEQQINITWDFILLNGYITWHNFYYNKYRKYMVQSMYCNHKLFLAGTKYYTIYGA